MKKALARLQRKKRIRAKVSGTSERPRLVVFRSNTHIFAQLIDDSVGKTLVSAKDLKETSGSKLERAEKIGKIIAEEAGKQNISRCVFDRNGYQYHGRVKALAEGARQGGLVF